MTPTERVKVSNQVTADHADICENLRLHVDRLAGLIGPRGLFKPSTVQATVGLDCMGSQHHAREARLRRERVLGMLCLEMVGYYRREPYSQEIPPAIPRLLHRFFPRRGDFLAAVGNLASWKLSWAFRRGFKKASRLPLFSICLPEAVHEIRLSDNSSFWDQGYPALMLTDTSFLRNPHYHMSSDLPETLDYDVMTQVTLGVAGAVRRLVGTARGDA